MVTPLTNALQVADCAMKWIPEFGGQGLDYWSEIKQLYGNGPTFTQKLLNQAADALFEESSTSEAQASTAFKTVMDLKQWLVDDESTHYSLPQSSVWQQRAVFSYALIALTQAANYVAFLEAAGVSHEKIFKHTSCAIGHSQGIVSAAIFASAGSTEEYVAHAMQFIRYMFWHGLRAQETFLKLSSTQDASKLKGATPMLSVIGLTKQQVLAAIDAVSSQTSTDNLHLSLINGLDLFCVTGLPSTLEHLKQALELCLHRLTPSSRAFLIRIVSQWARLHLSAFHVRSTRCCWNPPRTRSWSMSSGSMLSSRDRICLCLSSLRPYKLRTCRLLVTTISCQLSWRCSSRNLPTELRHGRKSLRSTQMRLISWTLAQMSVLPT